MSLLDMIKQSDPLVWLAVGVALILYFLFKRVSALTKTVDDIKIRLKALEERVQTGVSNNEIPLGAISETPSNAVIAAITAAINQYQIDNN